MIIVRLDELSVIFKDDYQLGDTIMFKYKPYTVVAIGDGEVCLKRQASVDECLRLLNKVKLMVEDLNHD